jgi:hypothetical protein
MAGPAQQDGRDDLSTKQGRAHFASDGAPAAASGLEAKIAKGKGVLDMQNIASSERQIVLVVQHHEEEIGVDDEEYAFEDDEEAV